MGHEAEYFYPKKILFHSKIHAASEYSHSKEAAHISIFKSQNVSNASHFLNNAPHQPPDYMSNTSDVKEAHLY